MPDEPRMLTVLGFADASERHREFDAVISVENPSIGKRLRFLADGGAPPQLVLSFDDVDHDHGDAFVTLPTVAHVRESLEFARRHSGGRILVHCQAGKCRSTAIALAILAERLGAGREAQAVSDLLAIRPEALVNLVALSAADDTLSRNGGLARAWDAYERATPGAVERRARKTAFHAALRRRWLRDGRIEPRAEDLAPSP